MHRYTPPSPTHTHVFDFSRPIIADLAGTRTWMAHSACGCAPTQCSQCLPIAKHFWVPKVFSVDQDVHLCRFMFFKAQPSLPPFAFDVGRPFLIADIVWARAWIAGVHPPSLLTLPSLGPRGSLRLVGVHPPLDADLTGTRTWMVHSACGCAPTPHCRPCRDSDLDGPLGLRVCTHSIFAMFANSQTLLDASSVLS